MRSVFAPFIRIAALLFCVGMATQEAAAHSGASTGFASITLSANTARYTLTLAQIPPGPLASRMHADTASPDYPQLLAAVRSGVRISNDGLNCAPSEGQVTAPGANDPGIKLTLDFVCTQALRKVTIHDETMEDLGKDHHTLAMIVWTGGSQQFAFGADARETQITLGGTQATARGAGSFYPLGIEHILTGYDHLVFLLALILRGGNIWSLLKIITAFTLAHSVTLALAALNIVVMPERLIEATIALSIAYVAAENLFLKQTISHRWAVSFLFGLVHGFGFSNVLRELGLPSEGLAWSLLNFNLGVETGQAVAVLIAVPVLIWLRRFRWEPRAVTAVSAIVLLAGLGLFVDRAFFESFG